MAEGAENQEIVVRPKLTDENAVVHDDGEYAMLFDSARFNQAQRVAKLFSESKLVPDHFRGSAASVFVALHMAMRMNLDPMMVMQKTYIIAGKPGMEAQLLIALVNARGPFTGPIQWEFAGEGDNRQCTAYAIHAKTGERCEMTVTWKMVKAEGWAGKSGSKWQTIPDLMFRYRSATYLARLYCPEVIMGLSTVDELQEMDVIDVTPEPIPAIQSESRAEKVRGKLKKQRAEEPPPEPPQATPTPEPQPSSPAPEKEATTGNTEGQSESSVPTMDELLAELAGKGWPLEKLQIKFGKKQADWGDAELKALADLVAV
jgi:hypothetical protein